MEFNYNVNRISKYFSLSPLRQTERQAMFALEDAQWKHLYTEQMHNISYIFGLEIEVEHVPEPHVRAPCRSYWTLTADQSLRNNGVEFVSVPLKGFQIEGALRQLASSLPDTHEFTPRTSVHVHMNVRDLTINQIASLMLVYTAVENLLFDWVGHDRDKNVFCTKILETEYITNYAEFCAYPQNTIEKWNKYTALNIYPIMDKGTIEFRHMYGTIEIKKLMDWINILSLLKTKAKRITPQQALQEISQLNTTSTYEEFVMEVFKEYGPQLLHRGKNTQEAMEETVSYVKLVLLNQDTANTTQQYREEVMMGTMNVATAPTIQRYIDTLNIPHFREIEGATATARRIVTRG